MRTLRGLVEGSDTLSSSQRHVASDLRAALFVTFDVQRPANQARSVFHCSQAHATRLRRPAAATPGQNLCRCRSTSKLI